MRNRTFFVFFVFVLLLISGSIASKLWKHPFQTLEARRLKSLLPHAEHSLRFLYVS